MTTRRGDPPTVAGSAGYWADITPSATALTRPCDAVYVSTACKITGKRAAIGATDTPTATPTLAADVPHPLRFYTIESVTNGATVTAIWYDDPAATNASSGWAPGVAS